MTSTTIQTAYQRLVALPRQAALAGWVLMAVLLALAALWLARTGPVSVDTRLGDTEVRYSIDADTLIWPDRCVLAQWDVERVAGVFLNFEGQPGQSEREVCIGEDGRLSPSLLVLLPEGGERVFILHVDTRRGDLVWVAGLLAAGALMMAFATGLNWRPRTQSMLHAALIAAAGIALATFAAELFAQQPDVYNWDDSLIFTRYAHNLATYGDLRWNPTGEPTYGATELLYVAAVWWVDRLTPEAHTHLATYITSFAAGVLFLLLLFRLAWQAAGPEPTARWLAVTVTALGIAWGREPLAGHFLSGMGTTFVLAYLTGFILLLLHHMRDRPSRRHLIAVGIVGGLAFAIRPDLLLFVAAAPAMLFLLGDATARRGALLLAGVSSGVVLAQMAAAWLYFGSPLPLSFFVKSTPLYDAYIYNQYVAVPGEQLALYLRSNAVFLVVIATGALLAGRDLAARLRQVDAGLVLAAIAYALYYLFLVLQLMFYQQRFYYPTLPVLVLVAAYASAALWQHFGKGQEVLLDRRRTYAFALPLLVVVLLPGMLARGTQQAYESLRAGAAGADRVFEIDSIEALAAGSRWFALDAFAAVSADLVIATTEVGLPGAANFDWTVVDMAGLNETDYALNGFTPDALFDTHAPDLIYLPHLDYIAMREAITTHPEFLAGYEVFPSRIVEKAMGVALRQDSPHYAAMREIVIAHAAPFEE